MRRLLLLSLALCSCNTKETRAEPAKPEPTVATPTKSAPKVADATPSTPPPAKVVYPWLEAGKADVGRTLLATFAPPAGHERVPLKDGSFGAFLRTLPLSPEGTPVRAYHGGQIHPATHENVAAVVDIDVGKGDLQQCADSVIRLHAEWLWANGKRDVHYTAAGGLDLPFSRFLAGERLSYEGGKLGFSKIAPKTEPEHGAYRKWLDEVFGWANTASLNKEAAPVALADMTAGDFFVMPGVPFGHAVLVLDVARSADGKRKLLLGQGFMPAQSFHVLRPSAKETWFTVDDASGEMVTPFWKPFPFSTLRRLGG